MNLDFVAIDVETANPDMSSICQIGLAEYENGRLVDLWSSLIDPEDYFDVINMEIHGISELDVVGKPGFPEIFEELADFLDGTVCVSHTHFDRVSISRALEKYGLPDFDTIWLDSAKVARRAWKEFSRRGYGLANVCAKLGYDFNHHDALEDAKASGYILLRAVEQTGLDVPSWLKRVNQPINPSRPSITKTIKSDGNPEGELYGETIVFTGTLEIPRRKAAVLASSMGCRVTAGVTKATTLLVVGDQDISKLAGKEKSLKHIKAEKLIKKGQSIRILTESDFKKLVYHTINHI